MKKFRVWYQPYGLSGESDFIDVTAENEDEARRFASSCGYVEEVYEIKA